MRFWQRVLVLRCCLSGGYPALRSSIRTLPLAAACS